MTRENEPGICLAMIVRDAEEFILDTLASVVPLIRRWVVIDTGSVDDTAAAVQSFFDAAGIPGTLLHRPWVGFAHNRTELLQHCAGHGSFALMMDADDVLCGTLPLDHLDADCYRLQFGTDFRFWRPALFRLSKRWEFRGVVHEYAVCLDDGAITENLDGPYIAYRSIGSRGMDPRRFQRDLDLLLAEHAEHPDDARTAFYIAQSYRDHGDDERALHWYSTRMAMPGWDEETFVAALEAARIVGRREDAAADDVASAYLAAWALRPDRAEPLHDLARWHRERRRWADGYLAATRAELIPFPADDLLFVNADVYSWRSTDERSVCASHLGLHDEVVELTDRLLRSSALPLEERDRIVANRNLSAPPNAYELAGRQQYPQHQQISVAVIANWRDGDQVAVQWRRQFPAEGSWRGVRLVAAAECAEPPDYWVIVNHPRAHDEVPPSERSIVLQMEPSMTTQTWGAWSDPDPAAFVQVRSHALTPNFCEWHLGATYDELWTMSIEKTRTLSTVVSSRRQSIAQNQRLDLVHELERHGVPIDVFGRDNDEGFTNYNGPLPELDKRDGLLPYRYTIAVENSAEQNYLTEKLVDAVLAECLCFYWGCPDAEELLGDDAFIRLPIDDPVASRELIEATIAAGEYERRLPAIRRAKRRILDDLQLAPTLARVVHGHRLAEDMRVHVINLDRRSDRLTDFRSRLTEALGPAVVERCERLSAVDGDDLQMSDEIAYLFRGSQLPLRRHQTACSLSHLALWWETASGDGRPSLVLEDDAYFERGFKTRFVEVCGWLHEHPSDADVIFLGHTNWEDIQPSTSARQRVERVGAKPRMGGTFAYVITQSGARRLLDVAKETGISTAIDTFILCVADRLAVWDAVPSIATSPVARRGGPVIDSDIQYDLSTL